MHFISCLIEKDTQELEFFNELFRINSIANVETFFLMGKRFSNNVNCLIFKALKNFIKVLEK